MNIQEQIIISDRLFSNPFITVGQFLTVLIGDVSFFFPARYSMYKQKGVSHVCSCRSRLYFFIRPGWLEPVRRPV